MDVLDKEDFKSTQVKELRKTGIEEDWNTFFVLLYWANLAATYPLKSS